jgi:hypothetical protein
MDYRNYSSTINYPGLVANYEVIESVLVDKLKQLKDEGFQPDKGFMYGYSYGTHLVINSAISVFGNRNFGMIDGRYFENTKKNRFQALHSSFQSVNQPEFTAKLTMHHRPRKMYNASTHQLTLEHRDVTALKIG